MPLLPLLTAEIPEIARVDFRVGLITEAKMHPDADALYVETSKPSSAHMLVKEKWRFQLGWAAECCVDIQY